MDSPFVFTYNTKQLSASAVYLHCAPSTLADPDPDMKLLTTHASSSVWGMHLSLRQSYRRFDGRGVCRPRRRKSDDFINSRFRRLNPATSRSRSRSFNTVTGRIRRLCVRSVVSASSYTHRMDRRLMLCPRRSCSLAAPCLILVYQNESARSSCVRPRPDEPVTRSLYIDKASPVLAAVSARK